MDSIVLDVIHLLQEYSWIYDFKLTNFFVDEVWKFMPESWSEHLTELSSEELNQIPFGFIKDTCPSDLEYFLKNTIHILPSRIQSKDINPVEIKSELKKGMCPKKLHEVANLAAVVHDLAQKTSCDVIVDVGSGLGYLGQILNSYYHYKIIGLESKSGHTSGAQKRLQCQNKKTTGFVTKTFELHDTPENIKEFETVVQKSLVKLEYQSSEETVNTNDETAKVKGNESNSSGTICIEKSEDFDNTSKVHACSYNGVNRADSSDLVSTASTACAVGDLHCTDCDNVCHEDQKSPLPYHSHKVLMVGLHCCGDLIPSMMKCYVGIDSIRGLCCVSCCYHRMKTLHDENERIKNFPLSETVKEACLLAEWSPSLFALRLAAQETRARWRHQSPEDHAYHIRRVAYRGILQLYLHKEKKDYSKMFRTIVKDCHCHSFTSYVDAACARTSLDREPEELGHVKRKLHEIYQTVEPFFRFIEPLTLLQVILQPALEWLVIKDRQLWLQEQGFPSDIIPVFDDFVSPRNLAITSAKSYI